MRPMHTDAFIDAELETTHAFRRDLHRHPELSRAEHRTTERLEAALSGLPVQIGRAHV